MIDANKVLLTGTIAEPRLGWLESGKPELRLSLTVEQEGGFKLYVQVYCYGARAEPLAENLESGDRVLIDGKLSWRSTTKAGVKESKMVVTTWDVQVLHSAGVPEEARTGDAEGQESSEGEIVAPEPRVRKRGYPKAALKGGFTPN